MTICLSFFSSFSSREICRLQNQISGEEFWRSFVAVCASFCFVFVAMLYKIEPLMCNKKNSAL
ncbi:hypothetical protein BD408DRAFT_411072 [Parasitella parasitica]|nr:hypothetical protein BD408DRAFT_411072 [Parasitella parasitica]